MVAVQMPEMLPPALRKRTAEANATNAINRLYSTRSWPSSFFQKVRKLFIFFTISFVVALLSRSLLPGSDYARNEWLKLVMWVLAGFKWGYWAVTSGYREGAGLGVAPDFAINSPSSFAAFSTEPRVAI